MTTTPPKTSMGFTAWLQLLFIALKLTGYIDWSWWWWVLAPIWISLIVAAVALVVYGWLVWREQQQCKGKSES